MLKHPKSLSDETLDVAIGGISRGSHDSYANLEVSHLLPPGRKLRGEKKPGGKQLHPDPQPSGI